MKNIYFPEKDEKLAEFLGIVLGDGNIYIRKEINIYQIRIASNNKDEVIYSNFIRNLCNNLFNIKSIQVVKKNTLYVCINNKEIANFLIDIGLKSGSSKGNDRHIPKWILEEKLLSKACIRGLIDTDGSVFRMSNKDPNLVRIQFKNFNKTLLDDVRNTLIKLEFNPSKIICGNRINISRKDNIIKYLKDIEFNNQKHISRLIKIAPWCSGLISSEKKSHKSISASGLSEI